MIESFNEILYIENNLDLYLMAWNNTWDKLSKKQSWNIYSFIQIFITIIDKHLFFSFIEIYLRENICLRYKM